METFTLILLLIVLAGFAFAAYMLNTTRWYRKEIISEECPCSHPCNEYCHNMKLEDNEVPGQIIKNQ